MPCAHKPPIRPASTSPEPAVASQGGAFAAMAARPSGAATTVSAPLSTTTAPASCEASWHSLSFCLTGAFCPFVLKIRANSPSCGVRIAGDSSRLFSDVKSFFGSSTKEVIASASSTTARRPFKAVSTMSRMGAPTPPPGPITTALTRRSASRPLKSSGPSHGRTITDRLAAALTASASVGVASVTSPAPARSAPRAARRAALEVVNPPDSTTAWPRVYL